MFFIATSLVACLAMLVWADDKKPAGVPTSTPSATSAPATTQPGFHPGQQRGFEPRPRERERDFEPRLPRMLEDRGRGMMESPTSAPGATQPTSRPAPPRLSEERIGELMDRMKTEQPDMYQHMQELQKTRPAAFARMIVDVDRSVRQMDALPPELRESFRQLREDNIRAADLVKQIRNAQDQTEKQRLTEELQQVVSRQFDNMQKKREYDLQQLTRRLDDLKHELNDRAARRSEFIDTRVKTLLEGRAGRAW